MHCLALSETIINCRHILLMDRR